MRSILVSGGSGSFGTAYVKHLLEQEDYDRIIVYSRGEHRQDEMARELNDERLRFFIGDVRDLGRLEMAMRGVTTVVHAAAMKIVPTAEYNPTECVATNVYGTENIVKAAIRCGVRRVVGLSTDKAVSPVNLYGTTKLAAERILIAANSLSGGACQFNVVRYGNVAGSSGSVIPLFLKQKAEGKPLTVTSPNMSRFFLRMAQAVDLVDTAINFTTHSNILVPKIPSAMVVDIARAIAGENFTFIGVRPGEKTHETLITEYESVHTDDCDDMYVINRNRPEQTSTFEYSSNTNDRWLEPYEIKDMVCACS